MLRERPELPIAFGLSPFTPIAQVREAIERGGDPRVFAQRGRLIAEDGRDYLESLDARTRVPGSVQRLGGGHARATRSHDSRYQDDRAGDAR